jgi:hypothetical protein
LISHCGRRRGLPETSADRTVKEDILRLLDGGRAFSQIALANIVIDQLVERRIGVNPLLVPSASL